MNLLFLVDIDAGGEFIATQTLIEEIKIKHPNIKIFIIGRSLQYKPRLLIKELYEKIGRAHV